MEKFGIFELLDTLSALMEDKGEGEKAVPPPDPKDGAFAPPPYAAPAEANALQGLLERHDKMSRRIDKKP